MNLLTIKTLKDGNVIRTLLNYPSLSEALSAIYYELWYASSDQNVKTCIAELIDDDGHICKYENYFAPEPVAESEGEGNE